MFGLFGSKGPFNASISPSGDTIKVESGDNLLKAALANGLAWPNNCRVGSCGECRCKLKSGKIKPLADFSYVLDGKELDDGMILACQTQLKSDVEIEVEYVQSSKTLSVPETIDGSISNIEQLTHDIRAITVKLDKNIPAFLSGQYADLKVPGVIDKGRSYSFANAPEGSDNEVTFFIRHVPNGEMTSWIHADDRLNSRVELTGPYGTFYLRDSDGPMICIAGGSGMAPIKALLEEVAEKKFGRDVVYLFGARAQEDLYCLEEMEALVKQSKGKFKFIPVLSREPEDSDWTGLRGLITEFITKDIIDLPNSHAYLCGPPPMIDSAIEKLVEGGVDKDSIFFDKFLDASTIPGGRS